MNEEEFKEEIRRINEILLPVSREGDNYQMRLVVELLSKIKPHEYERLYDYFHGVNEWEA